MMMRAAVLSKGGVTVESVPAPVPATDDDALVRVLRAGVCNTDLELIDGYGLQGTPPQQHSVHWRLWKPSEVVERPTKRALFFFFARELTDSDGQTL